ncbi:7-deoxyloganetin glucosyltransferase-like [Macadamia integrifolia]|uniref:7-deoxyloganetin glucosyltransferase-like n=1 Tax=Macadamia integrifolia TaxID=60698 RepID=UPI001C4FEFE1|nr:7-deoxyloganetin glucosyltransferase-like [Macadamia integrifolia]
MGSFVAQNKPHAVCIPFPAQGHVNPMMQLAKLLHSRGFYVTFVNTEFNHKRLLRSKAPDALKGFSDFQFETIPDGLPPSDRDATQDVPSLCASVQKNCLAPLRDLLKKLNSSTSVPQISCIVSDGIMSFSIEAARELGIPEVQLWTTSACGFMGYLHYDELIKRGIIPLKDEKDINNGYLDTPIDWIPGMEDIRLKDLPSFIRTTDPNDIMLNFLGSEAQNCVKSSSAIMINTFDELEHEVLDAIASKFPNIYTVGPLALLSQNIPQTKLKSIPSSLWKEDFECLEWLDQKEPNSVVYVNFGSITVMSDQHLREFAWGLANSKFHFLWIIRADAVMGESAILSVEFMEEIKDRGLVVSWCPQEKVLLHSSIGVFLTHCGWNSTIESICGGVPIICWPFFAEQQTNCRYACTTWGIGMEINNDVKRDEVETLVKELMEGERGKIMRKKALDWKKKAEVATKHGGSSYSKFEKVIKEVLQPSEYFNGYM